MSKVIKGVIDLDNVDIRDLDTIFELILFLQENEIFENEWVVEKKKDHLFIKHRELDWTWIKIYPNGKIELDNHYGITEKTKDELIVMINKYYPLYKKTIEIINDPELALYKKNMTFDKEKEEILITIEEV